MSTARIVILKSLVDIIAKAGGLITFPILARFAGADGYGAYTQVNTVVGFLIPLASLGLSGAMVRFFSHLQWDFATRAHILRITFIVAITSALCSVLMGILALPLNELFLKWQQGEALFRWGAALVLLGALTQLQLDMLRARQRLYYLSFIQLADTLLTIAATAVVLPGGYGLIALIQATLLIKFSIFLFIAIGFWAWDKPGGLAAEVDVVPLKQMILFCMPLVISGLGVWMMNLVDRLVIGHFLSAESVGLYGAIYSFAALIVAFNSPLLLPLYPRLMQAVNLDVKENILQEVRTFHRYMSLVLIPAAVYLIMIIQPLLILMGSEPFRVDNAVVALIVVALFLDQWNGIAHYLLMCKDKVVFIQNMWIAMGVLNLIGNIILVPVLGLLGAALVTFLTYLVLDVIFFAYANRLLDMASAYRFRVSLKACAASLGAAGATLVLLGRIQPSILHIVSGTVIFGSAYCLLMVASREMGKAEINLVARALFIDRT